MFSGIVGHKEALARLEKLAASPRRAHAYLFLGPEGIGKAHIARAWASMLLGYAGNVSVHPDYYELKRVEEHILIDEVRAFIAFMQKRACMVACRVGIIADADRMQGPAGDALLKTLEEPSGDRVIILSALHRSTLSETIVSRCQIIEFSLIPDGELVAWLRLRYPDAKEEEITGAVVFAAGRAARAVAFLENQDERAIVLEQQKSIAEVLASGQISQAFQWIQEMFGPLKDKDGEEKRAMAERMLLGLEHVLHAQCLKDFSYVSTDALAAFETARHALAHNVSPQQNIEQLFLTVGGYERA